MRPKYASAEGVTIAELPELPFPKSNLGPSLAAYLAVSKFTDHLPF